ncbi:hypothetical protein [Peptoanaerobacter stomatis]|jgi:hypothetical protein|uniref:hypothetical protein n=1 Tax=Peptoanaerobacter stomatis TaxID=796937 RepID=UPI003FA13BA5
MEDNKFYNGSYIDDETNSIVMKAPLPVNNELKYIGDTFKFLCIGIPISFLFRSYKIADVIFCILVITLFVFYIYSDFKVKKEINNLSIRFKIIPNLDKKEFYYNIQHILSTKHRMLITPNENGVICVKYNGINYKINLGNNGIFIISWEDSSAVASLIGDLIGLLSRRYNKYKKLLHSMGIIAFEIQNAYGIR